MRTPQIIPVEELGKAALLFDAVGRWAQVDPFVLHGPPQALDKDVVVAAPASIHADLDPVIPQCLMTEKKRRPKRIYKNKSRKMPCRLFLLVIVQIWSQFARHTGAG